MEPRHNSNAIEQITEDEDLVYT